MKDLKPKYKQACDKLIALHAYTGINKVVVLPDRGRRGAALVISSADGRPDEIVIESWRINAELGALEYETHTLPALTDYWQRFRFIAQAGEHLGVVALSFAADFNKQAFYATNVDVTPALRERLNLPQLFEHAAAVWLTRDQLIKVLGLDVDRAREEWAKKTGQIPYLGMARR